MTESSNEKESSKIAIADNRHLTTSGDSAATPTMDEEPTKCVTKENSNKTKLDDKQTVNSDQKSVTENTSSVISRDSDSVDNSNGKETSDNVNNGKERISNLVNGGNDKTNGVNTSAKDKTCTVTGAKDKSTNSFISGKEKPNGISNGKGSVYDFTDGRDSPINCEKPLSHKASLKHVSGPKRTYSRSSPNGKLPINKDFPVKYTDGEVISQKLGKKLLKNKGSKDFDKSVYDCTGKVKSSKFNMIYTKHILNSN